MSQVKIPDTVVPNPKADYSAGKQLVQYTGQSIGAFRVLNQMQQMLKTWNQVRIQAGSKPVLKELESNLGIGKAMLAIPYLPKVTEGAIEALDDLKAKNGQAPEHLGKKAAVAVRNTTEATYVWLASANLALRSNPIGAAVAGLSAVEDTTDVGIRAYDVKKCIEMERLLEQSSNDTRVEKQAPSEVKKAVSDTKTHAMLRLAKAVCAAVGGILGLAMLAAGVALIPAIALACLSLAAASFAISSDFYRDTRAYNLISI